MHQPWLDRRRWPDAAREAQGQGLLRGVAAFRRDHRAPPECEARRQVRGAPEDRSLPGRHREVERDARRPRPQGRTRM
eukprot:2715695-Pyramimonas_sp.AAC.1